MQAEYEAGLIYQGDGIFKAYCPVMADECNKVFKVGDVYLSTFPELSTGKQRSKLQNKSLHLWFGMLALWLTSGGYTVQFVVSMLMAHTVVWTKEAVKEIIWRNIMRALLGKESTTQMSTEDVPLVFESVYDFLAVRIIGNGTEQQARRAGNIPDWPDRYSQSIEYWENKDES